MGAVGASFSAAGLGDLAVYEGRYAEAVRILEQGAAADLMAKTPGNAALKFVAAAYAHQLAGQSSQAVAAADKALRNGQSLAVRFQAARIFVEAGALDKARAIATELSAELPPESQAHGKIIEGQIALKSGNARDAIKTLIDANTLVDTWWGHLELGRAYLAVSEPTRAEGEIDRCIMRRGEALSLMNEGPTFGHFPAVLYYQGQVREAGKMAGVDESYGEYLKARGTSTEDPLLPEIRKHTGTKP
jgi:tetratricopeptide (TPR) repeat protein